MNIGVKSEKAIFILNEMIKTWSIPPNGDFEITDFMIDEYFFLYDKHFSSKGGMNDEKDIECAKRMASFVLLKLRESRTIKNENSTSIKNPKNKCGFVYVISNPAFDGCYKIGSTKDINSRLNVYQTCDPNRNYKIEHYAFCDDMRYKEKQILEQFNVDIVKGEWVRKENSKELLTALKRTCSSSG